MEPLEFVLEVATPVRLSMVCDQVKDFPMIGELVLPANLILMSIVKFDITLGIDWLPTYHAR